MLPKFFSMLLLFLLPAAIYALRGDIIPVSCEREGDIAFTFDQGPSKYTGALLSALSKHKVKATFHICPDYLDNPVILAYLRKAASDGHTVGVSIKEDVAKGKISDLKDYLSKTKAILKRTINYEPKYLRFPEPGPSDEALKLARSMGFVVTSYNLDSMDYVRDEDAGAVTCGAEGHGPVFYQFKQTFDEFLEPTKGSFISIQRDITENSVSQTPAILEYALKKGYHPVSLDQCLDKLRASKPSTPKKISGKKFKKAQESPSDTSSANTLCFSVLLISCVSLAVYCGLM